MSENNSSGIDITVSSSTFRRKHRMVVIKIRAEKHLLELSDVLGKHVGVPSFASHLEAGNKELIQMYFDKCESVLAQVVSTVAKAYSDKK